jgi:hypothetical protein
MIPQAGGLAAISRWLSEARATPPDSRRNSIISQAGGLAAISRWLSEARATPPDKIRLYARLVAVSHVDLAASFALAE